MQDLEIHFSEVARESIEVFDEVSRKASERITSSEGSSGSALATLNTFTDGAAVQREQQIRGGEMEGLRALARAPAIARVLARDEDENEHVYYISGQASISLDDGRVHASYRSPIGRLASLPPGEEISIELGGSKRVLEVVEITRYRPTRHGEDWDSLPTTFEGFDFDLLSYPSLRSLLEDDGAPDATSALDALLAGHESTQRINGLRHEIRSAIALREQPILDRFQDEIFRLPLDSRLMILGPPGTGKTTTLIKRLGQKLDREYLSAEEGRLADATDSKQRSFRRSWLMFTPTDLLKHYVREAFNREQIAASEEHIRTWESMRLELSRQVLGILQAANSRGKFIFREELNCLDRDVIRDPTRWFDDFSAYHGQRILDQLKAGMDMLRSLQDETNGELIARIGEVMERARASGVIQLLEALNRVEDDVTPVIKKLKDEADEAIRKQLALTFNRNQSFLHDLAGFIDSLQADDEDEIADDDEFDDDVGDDSSEQTSVQKAARVYSRTIRSAARYRFQGRSIPAKSRTRVILDWLGGRAPDDAILKTIGSNIALQNALRRFMQAHRRFVLDVPSSYRAFRKQREKEGRWYQHLPANNRHASGGELDGMVLLILQCARGIYQSRRLRSRLDQPGFDYLRAITDRLRAQVLVDEATDFSPVQLACMRALSLPETDSFFACGDFNQRITSWGTRDAAQLKWASPGMETRNIAVVYRQSRTLNEFSHRLLESFDGDTQSRGELPGHVIHDGVPPALAEELQDAEGMAVWLFERVQEVERMVGSGKMPSIAVLVNSEDQVVPMAKAMNVLLEDINLQAMACQEGQVLGEHGQIRVFDVRHIKGLEFEAVFFAGVDELAEHLPELFGKYLYVGATRAATYFGMACRGRLPKVLEPLRSELIGDWSQ